MVPKFRGDSEDWLDQQGASSRGRSGRRPKAKGNARSLDLDPEQANAVVTEVFPNQCKIRLNQDGITLLCGYRRAEVVGKSKGEQKERTPVAVGDRVCVKQTGLRSGVVEGICKRKNQLLRVAPGQQRDSQQGQQSQAKEKIHHVLAANIDLLVVVSSAAEPAFSSGVVDRFLIAAAAEGIPALLVVSKKDLLKKGIPAPWKIYQELGYQVLEISSETGEGVLELREAIESKTVVFCGHSGVGKTSLLRLLLNQEVGKVASVSKVTGKGRHTTTGAILFSQPESPKSQWIDTPGIREFSLARIQDKELGLYFPEFKSISCESNACLHLDELGCKARELKRYASYRQILLSLLGEI
jgi:ribosome biogenesis GTPase